MLYAQNQAGSANQGVLAGRHWRGAGVVGRPRNLDTVNPPSGDAGDHPDRCPGLVQGRALLNMQLKVGSQLVLPPACVLNPAHVTANIGQRGTQRDTFIVNGGQVIGLQHSRHSSTAEQPAMKSGSLFIGEYQHLHWMLECEILVGQGLHHFYRPHDSQRAIIFATTGHGVGMRPQSESRKIRHRPVFSGDNIAP